MHAICLYAVVGHTASHQPQYMHLVAHSPYSAGALLKHVLSASSTVMAYAGQHVLHSLQSSALHSISRP